MNRYADRISSPLGPLLAVVDDDGALVRLAFDADAEAAGLGAPQGEDVAANGAHRAAARDGEPDVAWDAERCGVVRRQLDEYFDRTRRKFQLDLAPEGTHFQKTVWAELRRIPYGETISYGELARRLGRPDAARAVGRANGTNPVPIIVPCHRVIGADGSLTGYGGGVERKERLLALERAQLSIF